MSFNILGLAQQMLGSAGVNEQALAPVAMSAVASLIASHPGGLSGLVKDFENSGLGPQVQSWLSGGPNQAVSGADVQQAVDPEKLNQMSQQTGIPHQQLSGLLAAYLPQIINHLSPTGTLPADGAVGGHLASLKDALAQIAGGEAPVEAQPAA